MALTERGRAILAIIEIDLPTRRQVSAFSNLEEHGERLREIE
jgi:hypothetical protein